MQASSKSRSGAGDRPGRRVPENASGANAIGLGRQIEPLNFMRRKTSSTTVRGSPGRPRGRAKGCVLGRISETRPCPGRSFTPPPPDGAVVA